LTRVACQLGTRRVTLLWPDVKLPQQHPPEQGVQCARRLESEGVDQGSSRFGVPNGFRTLPALWIPTLGLSCVMR